MCHLPDVGFFLVKVVTQSSYARMTLSYFNPATEGYHIVSLRLGDFDKHKKAGERKSKSLFHKKATTEIIAQHEGAKFNNIGENIVWIFIHF